jgi:hypothetical protein
MDIRSSEYSMIHSWLRHNFGRATFCEQCHLDSKRYQYALIKGKCYEKKRENFIWLCVSCHKKYDVTSKSRKNLSKSKMGNHYKAVPISQLNREDETLINIFPSARYASKCLGILHTSISNALRGYSKSAGGFIWKFNS